MSSKEEILSHVKAQKETMVAEPTLTNPMWYLPFMERGFRWNLIVKGSLAGSLSPSASNANTTPIYLTKGGSYYKFPLPPNWKGWIISMYTIFDNPFGTFRFRLADWSFEASPYVMTMLQQGLQFAPNYDWLVHTSVWNPLSAMGPLYGLQLATVEPLSVMKDMSLEVYNPTTSIMSRVECLAFGIGAIEITDYTEFLDELQRVKIEFKAGAETQSWFRRKR